MNSNFPLLKPVRILLIPFSLLTYLYIWIRNKLYDKKIIHSASFNLPIICVGNLSVGGTGKSPMVEYLIRLLKADYRIATLSRGYKRKTAGFAIADETSTALDIGDEPMQFHIKHPDIAVAVGEERIVAIPQLLHDRPEVEVILLDDAFQHRPVKAGLNILLTDYNNLFTRDWYLPTGDLRDEKASYKRAEIIVVTKCPPTLSSDEKQRIISEINPLEHQQIYFSAIRYGKPYHIVNGDSSFNLKKDTEVLLVSGIANPRPLELYLQENSKTYWVQAFSDHHIFTIDDLKEIISKFQQLRSPEKIILTTEKDAVRLMKFSAELKDLPVYVIPIEPGFLFEEAQFFNEGIIKFIKDFKLSG
ncbi:MAG TPA: tetraacyldisaccharide 4'-kinase [Parasegetibacter sp.]|jgi:tetraacyldisaccharide 4'-kinase